MAAQEIRLEISTPD